MARRAAVCDGAETDVGDDDLAGVEASRARREPDLARLERDRERGVRRRRPRPRPSRRRRPTAGRRRRPGSPQALIRSIRAAASGRGAPWKPVPNSASMTTSHPSTASVSTASRPASRSTRAAILPSPPFEPPPQTTANRRASGYARIASRATAAPARSISSGAVAGNPGYASSAARISAAVQSGS